MYAFTPPTAGVFDAPAVSISLNVEWRSFVLGVLEKLITAPAFGIGNDVYLRHDDSVWTGDDDAQFNADQEIEKLMSALANGQGLVMIPPGSIQMYAGTTAPDGWLLCNGLDYLKADYPELWSVLGVAFEMSSIRFVVPDFLRRSPIGYDAETPNYDEMGALLGSPTHTLTTAQMPNHNHIQDSHNHTQDSHNHTQNSHFHVDPTHQHLMGTRVNASGFGGGALAQSNGASNNQAVTDVVGTGLAAATATNIAATATNIAATATNQSTGGGESHPIVHPVTVINYIIKT